MTENIQIIIILTCNQYSMLLMKWFTFFCTKFSKSTVYFILRVYLNLDAKLSLEIFAVYYISYNLPLKKSQIPQ